MVRRLSGALGTWHRLRARRSEPGVNPAIRRGAPACLAVYVLVLRNDRRPRVTHGGGCGDSDNAIDPGVAWSLHLRTLRTRGNLGPLLALCRYRVDFPVSFALSDRGTLLNDRTHRSQE